MFLFGVANAQPCPTIWGCQGNTSLNASYKFWGGQGPWPHLFLASCGCTYMIWYVLKSPGYYFPSQQNGFGSKHFSSCPLKIQNSRLSLPQWNGMPHPSSSDQYTLFNSANILSADPNATVSPNGRSVLCLACSREKSSEKFVELLFEW